jgi:dTDP-4-amino-4,6-dideoxygalactose transaminase
MVDLVNQHKKIENELNSAMAEVMNNTSFIKGPKVAQFEYNLSQFLNVKHVIGCGNGTDAIQIALMALELEPGAEVITPDFTFVATAEVVRLLGFTPVLVDVDLDTFNLSPEAVLKAISPKTKVIIPVHLFGQCADMGAILKIAKDHNLFVIEDTAQATGASWCEGDDRSGMAGTIGHIGTTSFFPSKNLGAAGDGGAIFTNDDDLADKIKSIANHGQGNQYYYKYIGVNSRLDTLQAAVLDVKLQYLTQYNKARYWAAEKYTELLNINPQLITPKIASYSNHIFHQYTLRILNGKRDDLMNYLNEHQIPNKIYYPLPLHLNHPYDVECRYNSNELQNTKQLCKDVLSLPMHSELTIEQIEFICSKINEFLK